MARKKRPRDRPRRERTDAAATAPPPRTERVRTAADFPPLPSLTARITGLAIGVITVGLAALLFRDAFADGRTAVDAATRVIGGVLMVGIGLAVCVLSLFPAQLRKRLRGV